MAILTEIYKIEAIRHGVRLELRVKNILPIVEADTSQLRGLFTDLLQNAIKFSKVEESSHKS